MPQQKVDKQGTVRRGLHFCVVTMGAYQRSSIMRGQAAVSTHANKNRQIGKQMLGQFTQK
eukprot:4339730-Prorocentrum_lima.AAC.1